MVHLGEKKSRLDPPGGLSVGFEPNLFDAGCFNTVNRTKSRLLLKSRLLGISISASSVMDWLVEPSR